LADRFRREGVVADLRIGCTPSMPPRQGPPRSLRGRELRDLAEAALP